MISTYLQCRRKFLLTVNRFQNPFKVKNTHFGSLVHDFLDYYYSNLENMQNKGEYEINVLLDQVAKEFREHNREELSYVEPQALETAVGVYKALMLEYHTYYEDDLYKWNIISTEEEFCETFLGVTLRGKIDGTFQMVGGKKIIQLEHKTKGRFNVDNIVKKLGFDFQNLFYVFVKRKLQGVKVSSTLYNIIRNPQLRIKKNEELQEFIDRVREDVQQRPEHYFVRCTAIYKKKDFDEFEQRLSAIIREIKMVIKGELPTYKNSIHCDSPFVCEYLNMCSNDSTAGYTRREKLFPELDFEEYKEKRDADGWTIKGK